MIEREKVLYGLEQIADTTQRSDLQELIEGAIFLLKEQEPIEPINSYGTFRCGNCGHIVGYNDDEGHGYQNNFCGQCGKAVKWDNVIRMLEEKK